LSGTSNPVTASITDNSQGSGTTTLTIHCPAAGDYEIDDILDGPSKRLAVVVEGEGVSMFLSDCNYSGGTTVGEGAQLWIGCPSWGWQGTLVGDIVNDGQVWFCPATSWTYSGVVSGSGSVVVYGSTDSSTIVFTGANTYTGLTYIEHGGLQLGDGTTAGSINGSSYVYIYGQAILKYLEPTTGTIIPGQGIQSCNGTGQIINAGPGTLDYRGLDTYFAGTFQNTGSILHD
jgi:fibronectin-binding autotransporter adhesin